MAQQDPYGNWLGPPAPTAGLGRRPGIYSSPGKMSPVGDFRAGSPDSFEADYDDVSLEEPEREPPGKPGTVYSLAESPNPSQGGPSPSCGAPALPAAPEPKQRDRDGNSRGLGRAGTALSVLLGLSILGGTLLVGLALEKHREIREELKLLKSNCSENQESVWRALGAAQQQRTRLRAWIQRHFQELQDVAGLLCRTLEGSRRCSAGWRMFGKSCYSFSWESLSWGDARDACADLGAHLAIVDSDGEQQFLMENLNRSSSYWLGISEQQRGKWVWINGENPTLSFWKFWDEDQDEELKNCGLIGPGGVWNNDFCSNLNPWICEKSWNC